jgi:hypothetical protein
MPRWKSAFAACAIALGACASATAGDPKGFEDVFKGVEKGKRFHPLWPPVAHRSIVGYAVSARNANEIMATWESIESPTFLDGSVPFRFELGAVAYSAPELTQTRTIDVALGFAELDALAALAHPVAPGTTAASGATETKQTGVDVSLLKEVKRSIRGITVEYYTLGTLLGLPEALSPSGKAFLAPSARGWIVHRCLRLDGLDYTVTTREDVGAGFFAKLASWLPTVDVRYVNSRTVRLVANHPVYIGYKLWRPGADVAGVAARGEGDQDVHSLGLDANEIDRLAQAARTARQ